jgi:hypothetical protein
MGFRKCPSLLPLKGILWNVECNTVTFAQLRSTRSTACLFLFTRAHQRTAEKQSREKTGSPLITIPRPGPPLAKVPATGRQALSPTLEHRLAALVYHRPAAPTNSHHRLSLCATPHHAPFALLLFVSCVFSHSFTGLTAGRVARCSLPRP